MTAKHKLVKVLNALDVEDKMEMGLCFICDKPFNFEHQLWHHKNIQIVMMDEEEVEKECESFTQQQIDFSKFDGVVHKDEAPELKLDCHTATPTILLPKPQGIHTFNHNTNVHEPEQIQKTPSSTTTIPPKSPSLTNSIPEFSNSMLSDKDDKKKTHVEQEVVGDSNFETNVEMKNIEHNSSFLNGRNIVLTQSLKEGFTANPSIDASSLLQPTLQVFDQMPIKRLKPTSQNQQQATKTASVQVMVRRLKDFNRYKYFDPGGAIVPKSNARGFSWIQSQKATATVESPTVEQPTGPASGWPWVPRIISFQNRFMVVNEMCQREVQTFLLEMKGLSFTILFSFSCCRKLRDSSEQIYSLLVDEGNITLTLLMEAIHVVDLLFLLLLQKCSIVCFYFPFMFYVSSVECLIVDDGSVTSQDLTNRLHTFNLVFTARDILVLEDSNKTHGAIIVEIALLNCVSLASYFALMSYKIEYSNLAEIELVYVLISLDIVWKMMDNSIHGNVFKLTSGVYLLAIKCYVSMRCSSKIGFVKVGELVAFVLGLLVNHILNLHVINQITSF
ncbi:unnamed protein product [Trifolium pratense]|uniref:Uncharacterized protein n=1 Tax=Trifolium pratense TaxID=57577 RepID=A0ACB0LC59_TRIPR|nr:unnamed protein product [Trifolium pratense]